MPVLNYQVTAQSPLVLSARRPGGQFRESLPYIPGGVFRGSLARQLMEAAGTAGQLPGEVKPLFDSPTAPLFRNAVPGKVLPATAYTCKTDGGFPDDHTNNHGVFDSLMDRLCFEALRPTSLLYLPACPVCGGRVETAAGFCHFVDGVRRKVAPPSHLVTRVALNRRRGVAEDEMLYSPMVVPEGKLSSDRTFAPTVFHGSVVLRGGDPAFVKQHLEKLTHVGSGIARGFGRVSVTVEDHTESPVLNEPVAEFNARLRERWEQWAKLPRDGEPNHSPHKGGYFALLLVSDAILLEHGWEPTARLTQSALREAVGADETTPVELVRSYSTVDYVGGWNTAWGLPKDTQLAVRAGSVFVCFTPNLAEWLPLLEGLEELGVGERREEGFGQVRVCDEFHLEIAKEAKQ